MSEDCPKGSLAIDAMGSDLGPAEIVAAVALALKDNKDLEKVLIVGNADELKPLLTAANIENDPRVELVHASQVIAMDEKPIQSIKQKKDSSLLRAIDMVKEKRAMGVLSCGNTGSLMAGGTIKLRPAPGVDRPAIGVIMPSRNHHFVLIDAGANPDAKPIHLAHNAVLGSNYCKVALNVENPRVGLLSIGTEEGKGNEVIHEANQLLKQLGSIVNYQGLVEGFQIFENHVDVIVCDGFVGNILLKTTESLFYLLKDYLKEELMQNPRRAR